MQWKGHTSLKVFIDIPRETVGVARNGNHRIILKF